jgi:hypothetical protein
VPILSFSSNNFAPSSSSTSSSPSSPSTSSSTSSSSSVLSEYENVKTYITKQCKLLQDLTILKFVLNNISTDFYKYLDYVTDQKRIKNYDGILTQYKFLSEKFKQRNCSCNFNSIEDNDAWQMCEICYKYHKLLITLRNKKSMVFFLLKIGELKYLIHKTITSLKLVNKKLSSYKRKYPHLNFLLNDNVFCLNDYESLLLNKLNKHKTCSHQTTHLLLSEVNVNSDVFRTNSLSQINQINDVSSFMCESAQQPFGSANQPFGSAQQPFGSAQQPFGSAQQPFGSFSVKPSDELDDGLSCNFCNTLHDYGLEMSINECLRTKYDV